MQTKARRWPSHPDCLPEWLLCLSAAGPSASAAAAAVTLCAFRYGAGLNRDGTAFNDPNVKLTYVYMAAKHYTPGWSILDLYGFFSFVGIVDTNPLSVFLKLVGLRRGGENLQ